VSIRRIVIQRGRVAQTVDGAGDDVGFGWMKVAARRVDAQRPSGLAKLFPRRQAERQPEERAEIARGWRGGGSIRTRRQRELAGAGERTERIGLRRPVEIPERSSEAVEMVLGAVVIGKDGPGRAVRT
jgi:hypothetical protein